MCLTGTKGGMPFGLITSILSYERASSGPVGVLTRRSCVWFKGLDEHLTELLELLGTPDLFRE